MGGAAKTIGRVGSGVLTLGGSEIARNNLPSNSIVRQATQLPGAILTGGANGPSALPSLFGGAGAPNPYIGGPFSLDPNQVAGDQTAINKLGQSQFDSTNSFITADQAARTTARQTMADALTKQGQDVFKAGLPEIEEDLNARGLLNGSGLGQEIGRQQGNLAKNITNQVGVMGMNDIDLASQMRANSLQSLQGFQTGGLQRGLSLEDFVNQANVAKTIGAQMAPQPPSSKATTGSLLQGVGAMAPWASAGKGAATGGLKPSAADIAGGAFPRGYI